MSLTKQLIDSPVIFITGIGTDIGKTYATAHLAKLLLHEGRRVISQKMIQTGCQDESEDILKHRVLLGQKTLEEDKLGLTCPYIFTYPASPHMAAEKDGAQEIDERIITKATQDLLDRGYDHVLLEGAGGLMVPIRRGYLTADYVKENNYPIALVTGGYLGSINHTLATLEVCQYRKIDVSAIVYNRFCGREDKLIDDDTFRYLRDYLNTQFPKASLIDMPLF